MNMNAKMEKAFQYHQSGDLEQAADIYKALLQNNPNHPDLLHLLGILVQQKDDGAKVLTLFSRAIQMSPTNPFYYISLGDALKAQYSGNVPGSILRSGVHNDDFIDKRFNASKAFCQIFFFIFGNHAK